MGLIGGILILPYMVLFFSVWLFHMLSRPVAYASIACMVLNPFAAKRKLKLFVDTFRYLAFCKDKKWKEQEPLKYSKVIKVETKTVIFVRHGESTWNETFNKGDRSKIKFYLGFLPNAIKAFIIEWYFMVTGQDRESWFYDSPLSEKGKAQAEGVRKFLRTDLTYSTPKEARLIRILLGESPDGKSSSSREASSQMLCSNLRRAISTIAIGVKDRMDRNYENDNIMILQELQEISFNPDALSICPPKGKCELAFTDPKFLKPYFEKRMDTSKLLGNKPIDTNGLKRLNAFCEFLFNDVKKENVVAAGHSLFFRSFFKEFLPKDYDHISKVKKISNGGCVGFTLEKKTTDAGVFYEVTPGSIVVLYVGFQ